MTPEEVVRTRIRYAYELTSSDQLDRRVFDELYADDVVGVDMALELTRVGRSAFWGHALAISGAPRFFTTDFRGWYGGDAGGVARIGWTIPSTTLANMGFPDRPPCVLECVEIITFRECRISEIRWLYDTGTFYRHIGHELAPFKELWARAKAAVRAEY